VVRCVLKIGHLDTILDIEYRVSMAAPKTPNVAAAAAKRRRQGQETMAQKLRAAGWEVTPPPECITCGARLHWCDDMYACTGCGDEWDYKSVHGKDLV
jgi:hypothetical protein